MTRKDRGGFLKKLSDQLMLLVFLALGTMHVRNEWIPLGGLSPYLLTTVMGVPVVLLACWIWRALAAMRLREEPENLNPTFTVRRSGLKKWVFVAVVNILASLIRLVVELSEASAAWIGISLWFAASACLTV